MHWPVKFKFSKLVCTLLLIKLIIYKEIICSSATYQCNYYNCWPKIQMWHYSLYRWYSARRSSQRNMNKLPKYQLLCWMRWEQWRMKGHPEGLWGSSYWLLWRKSMFFSSCKKFSVTKFQIVISKIEPFQHTSTRPVNWWPFPGRGCCSQTSCNCRTCIADITSEVDDPADNCWVSRHTAVLNSRCICFWAVICNN